MADSEKNTPPTDEPTRFRTTSKTALEEKIEAQAEGGLAARTAHEMSLHDELSRTPTDAEKSEGE